MCVAFPGTINLHQVNTVNAGLLRKYKVNLLGHYSECKECPLDPNSKISQYTPWKNERNAKMISNTPESDHCNFIPAEEHSV
jgi:hypothetical protein